MPTHHLAELNVAHLAAPLDSPVLKDFVANLDRINGLAENSPGFVWRHLSSPQASAMETRLFGKDHIVTMSVWTDRDHLHDFVYRSAHTPIMARRHEWFIRMSEASQVLWWIPADARPTLLEGSRQLKHLRENGPSAEAFTFKQAWPAPPHSATA